MTRDLKQRLIRVTNISKMQVYEKSDIDTRTFSQIWENLSQNERDDLTLRLYNAKCCKNRQTIWKWATEKCAPREPLVREGVSKTVAKFLGAKVSVQTLFPSK